MGLFFWACLKLANPFFFSVMPIVLGGAVLEAGVGKSA
jgi:hypothetical protein